MNNLFDILRFKSRVENKILVKHSAGGREPDFPYEDTLRTTIKMRKSTHTALWQALPVSGHTTKNQFIDAAILAYIDSINQH